MYICICKLCFIYYPYYYNMYIPKVGSLLEASGGFLFHCLKKGYRPSDNKFKNGALATIM